MQNIIGELSKRIADNQRNSYIFGVVVGITLYLLVLYFRGWDIISLILGEEFLTLAVVTGTVMRFLGGLGIALTYASFCAFAFRALSSWIRGKRKRLRLATLLVLIPALALAAYAIYTIWSALFLSRPLSFIEYATAIFGVWSLIIMVYILPIIKSEYTPDLNQRKTGGVHQRVDAWKFSIWRGYQSKIRKNYGRVAEEEFERYGARLFTIRAVLSGLLLLPISFVLITIPPLAIVSAILWVRIFSLNHRYFSRIERGMLVLVTGLVALLTTVTFAQAETHGFNLFFSVSSGAGLLVGLVLLFMIIRDK